MKQLVSLREKIDAEIEKYLREIRPQEEVKGLIELHRSVGYSLTSGGARFRPVLSLLTMQALGKNEDEVLPFAVALELVHTYSLIHDDLPSMDDDDFRRGRPSNHKVFGESLAVLAGDALATEPYRLIADKYVAQPATAVNLVKILAHAAGPAGMVGGQAVDICTTQEKAPGEKDIEFLHRLKTVALFKAAVNGAAEVAQASAAQKTALDAYAGYLGLLFQIADDIADGKQDKGPSFVKVSGLENALKYCQKLRNSAMDSAKGFEVLQDFAQHIFERADNAS